MNVLASTTRGAITVGNSLLRRSHNVGSISLPLLVRNRGTTSTTHLSPAPEPTLPDTHVPPYRPRPEEPVESIRARLLYQSRKRGMLENDLLLSTFAAKFLDSMTDEELRDYDRLINLPSNDWDIYYWATGVKPIPMEFDTPMMQKFISHVQNSNRETRLRQPNLFTNVD